MTNLIVRRTVLVSFILLAASSAVGSTRVTHGRVIVQHKTFDHNHPPKELAGEQLETAVTIGEFDLQIGLRLEPGDKRQLFNGRWQQSMDVVGLNLAVGMKITILLPDDAPDKLKAHEEGHRQMGEKIYAERADKAAKEAARLMDGRRFTAEADTARDLDKAMDQVMSDAQQALYHAYMAQTSDVSARAGNIYDEITRHGTRMDIDEKTAAQQAFERLAQESKNPAATRPASPFDR